MVGGDGWKGRAEFAGPVDGDKQFLPAEAKKGRLTHSAACQRRRAATLPAHRCGLWHRMAGVGLPLERRRVAARPARSTRIEPAESGSLQSRMRRVVIPDPSIPPFAVLCGPLRPSRLCDPILLQTAAETYKFANSPPHVFLRASPRKIQ